MLWNIIADTGLTFKGEGRIFVEAEEDANRILLELKIKKEDVYQKQQGEPCTQSVGAFKVNIDLIAETLIVWTDCNGVDMALSFQEAEGCSAVW